MSWPPWLLKVRVGKRRHAIALWLPLFIIWPVVLAFVLAIFLLLLPFALLAMLFTWRLGWWRPALLGPPALLRVFCALRGLTVDVDSADGQVQVIFR